MISTGNPDISAIHAAVQKAIDKSEGKKTEKKKSTSASKSTDGSTRKKASTTGGSIGNLKQGYAANQADRPLLGVLTPVGCRRTATTAG